MRTRLIFLSTAVTITTLSAPALAEERTVLSPVVVTASHREYLDVDAPYASEVYTAEQIERSGADTLYDFLDKQTSLVVLPSYGNPFSQKIDMRGFGIGDGYQNIAISLNGRRLNNIDMVPQLLSAIPLGNIDRIEITKGSGSVAYGDGATAGSIQIYTKPSDQIGANLVAGNFGFRQASVTAGFSTEQFDFSINANRHEQDGYAEPDITGIRDWAESKGHQAQLALFPLEWLELNLGLDNTHIDTRYPGPLTLAEFKSDPSQNGGNVYTGQEFDTETWNFGIKADIRTDLTLGWEHADENKSSYYSSGWGSDYEYISDRLTLNYQAGNLSVGAGVDLFDGVRIGAFDRTSKKNRGYFIEGDYRQDNTVYSLGARKEEIDYQYDPSFGSTLSGEQNLNAWNLGFNHRFNEQLSLFSNLNSAFQAPDIDRFFVWGGGFNAFIDPAKSKTVNVGANLTLPSDKLKVTLYYTRMRDEIYYNAATFTNTNIDKSHKYGLEFQETHRFSDALSASVNYNYTRAIIDSEDAGGGAFDGRELPGVSRHTLNFGLDYQMSPRSAFSLSHTYRSSAYAADDFSNSNSQKQDAYNSTDLTYTYTLNDHFALTARVENLFEEANGIWVDDDAIYPVNFTRNWSIGIRAAF